jgi:glycosyltransferase involved in cell wall biosynthesis
MGNRQSTIGNRQPKARVAVVSPFLDKRHGTERCVTEQIERLAEAYEIHVYSDRVEDMDSSRIVWHRVPALPGPHLFAYCWWVVANQLCRWWDAQVRGFAPSMVYSPGINCFDADVISVHVVFGAYRGCAGKALDFHAHPARSWPRLLHRRMYYRLLIGLEHLVYGGKRATLTAISTKAARNLRCYGRDESQIPVILYGIDSVRFRPETRQGLRESARRALGLKEGDFCLLLVGNDWRNKGLRCLIESLSRLAVSSIRLLVVGHDTVDPYREAITQFHLEHQIIFLPERPDIEFYYGAADLYAGPSLEDAFALPPLEAMACGVPALVSRQAGVSEVISDGVDGFVLDDPQDSSRVAEIVLLLYQNEGLRRRVGETAAKTARQYTWDHNAEQLGALFEEVLEKRKSGDRNQKNRESKLESRSSSKI